VDVAGDKADLTLLRRDAAELSIKLGAASMHGTVRRDGNTFHVFTDGRHYPLVFNDPMAHAGEAEVASGRLTAPMPGKIVAIHVAKGQTVAKGTPLLIMEAMKMEHTIAAPEAGLVEELLYQVGDQVADGAQLLTLKPAITTEGGCHVQS
jgi:3-methylcrotonyl-CoA carboxylase alpha subunit